MPHTAPEADMKSPLYFNSADATPLTAGAYFAMAWLVLELRMWHMLSVLSSV